MTTGLEKVYPGFWRIRFSRILEGEDYSFYVNIDSNTKSIALLSYIPPTEILYAYKDLKDVSLMKDLLNNHPRLNISVPQKIEEKIKERRRKEIEYQEKVKKLSENGDIRYTAETFESGIYVRQGESKVIQAENGPIGTTGVGPCVAVCARGWDKDRKIFLGFAHMETTQNEKTVLEQLRSGLKSSGVSEEQIEIFLVGGWRTTEELQKRLLALSGQFPIRGVRINMKDKGLEYPEKNNYIDVVVTREGRIVYGENGELFKISKK